MTHDHEKTPCDQGLLNQFVDGALSSAEKARVKAHLRQCQPCRSHVGQLMSISQQIRDRVAREANRVDFAAMEKAVVIKALKRYRKRERGGRWTSLKIAVPALAMASVLLFFAYSRFLVEPSPKPSAIINSFTASSASVMIFETPETRQTILWYTETPNADNNDDAV